jgi:hypothetical protein
VIGKFPTRNNIETVLFFSVGDEAFITLCTYNKAGKKIADYVLINYCTGEADYDMTGSFRITKDFMIVHTDSILNWDVDSTDNEIAGTRKLDIKIDTVKILEDGTFEIKED